MNRIIQGFIIVTYFVPVSFVKLTIPLFDDRIASWSTFSDEEIWNTAMLMAMPSMGLLSYLIIRILGVLNKEPSFKQYDLLDDIKEVDDI